MSSTFTQNCRSSADRDEFVNVAKMADDNICILFSCVLEGDIIKVHDSGKKRKRSMLSFHKYVGSIEISLT